MASTICAVATAPAEGGIGVIRISGADALEVSRALAPDVPPSPSPRHAYFTRLTDRSGAVLDEGLFLFFRGPASFTGEDVVELHAHGSPRLLALLQAELLREDRVRLARPGEFTQRAFLHGRLDLARAEAVAALVSAQSEASVRAAAAQLRGALSERVASVRAALIPVQADLEGVLNFPDEAEGAELGLEGRVKGAGAEVAALLADAGRGALVRRGARVVLFGPVNAGKSTLFNRLIGADRALVDPEPGTTRDLLEARIELGGAGVTLVDTAGLRESPGRLEQRGIDKAREAIASADLAVLLIPPNAGEAEAAKWVAVAQQVPLLQVHSRADEVSEVATDALRISGRTGEGVDRLLAELQQRVFGDTGAILAASEAHVDALRRASEALGRAAVAVAHSTLEVVAGEVGIALEAMGEITGESASAEVIDAIFRRFCIGK